MAPDMTIGEVGRIVAKVDGELTEHRKETRRELEAINRHLDKLNGKVATHERATIEHAVKIANLNREVFDRYREEPAEPPEVKVPAELNDLIQLARDAKGAAKVVRFLWGLLGGGLGYLVPWMISEVFKR